MAIQSRQQAYLAGNKVYGSGRSNPTMGPVDRMGYKERDAKASARRNAILKRLQAHQSGKHASADSLRKV